MQRIIKEGYRSLAKRTLELYKSLERNTATSYSEDIENQFKANLEKISITGDIISIGQSGARNFHDVMDMLGQAIPPNLKPDGFQTSLAFALYLITTYFGMSIDEFLKKSRITSFGYNANLAGIATLGNSNNLQRILYVSFDYRRPAHSVIVNVHELYHALQPERQEIEEILIEKTKIRGYSRLVEAIASDTTLRRKRAEIIMASNELNFFELPEVLAKAKKVGVDLKEFRAYLKKYVPRVNFLTCYTEGEAYILQRDVIANSPLLQRYGIILKAYELMSLIDALLAPFLKPKEKVYEIGVGLFEYLRNHPDEKETLINSREFHRKLSDYLRNS